MITSFFKAKNPKPKARRAENDEQESSSKRTKVGEVITPSSSSNVAVQELLSHLTEDSWREALKTHLSSPGFASLAKFVASERKSKVVHPPECDVFSALNCLPLEKVKVIIVGQDPYHQPNQGHGLSFSVRKGVKIPPSLSNIYKELLNNGDEKTQNFPTRRPTHGNLDMWSNQGVLLLNAVLTVRNGEPNSHAKKGWEKFTDEVIRVLLSSTDRSYIFLLWGKPAMKKAESVISRYSKNSRHEVICTSHPSPLGATKTSSPFIGSQCFRRANAALEKMGLQGINWNVDKCDNKTEATDITV